MSMKSSTALMNMMTMALMLSDQENAERLAYEEREKVKRVTPPLEGYPVHHKGTRQYFFNAQGQFSNSRMLREDVVFKCIASNPKNAIRKFCKQFKVKPDDCYSLDV